MAIDETISTYEDNVIQPKAPEKQSKLIWSCNLVQLFSLLSSKKAFEAVQLHT